jgi:hypothetical protein
MPERELNVIAGALAKSAKPKAAQSQDALAKRWRTAAESERASQRQDVIPLLDGWIRRLERESGAIEPDQQPSRPSTQQS